MSHPQLSDIEGWPDPSRASDGPETVDTSAQTTSRICNPVPRFRGSPTDAPDPYTGIFSGPQGRNPDREGVLKGRAQLVCARQSEPGGGMLPSCHTALLVLLAAATRARVIPADLWQLDVLGIKGVIPLSAVGVDGSESSVSASDSLVEVRDLFLCSRLHGPRGQVVRVDLNLTPTSLLVVDEDRTQSDRLLTVVHRGDNIQIDI